jgi:hemoglobin
VPTADRHDIAGRDDIRDVVVAFYRRAFTDDLLGPVFVDVARMDLDEHLPTMCDFWETVLLRTGAYRGNALRPHLLLNAQVRLTPEHFDRWLRLWTTTIEERHRGERADHAALQARRIAGALLRRLGSSRPVDVHLA